MEKVDEEEKKSPVWNCGSSLYDSFELNAFKRQLDLAITSTSHFSDPLPPQPQPELVSKRSSNISRFLHKLRSVFRSKPTSNSISACFK
uniref:Uncharacterized protein n=1 Tax=Nelumbo nucifera TaxID=4432 RepID=A0A822YXT0_NELNU|nr:TPA_asm: hypothetical protein HUJ06_006962 [Nelumbo nucifera]